MTNVEITRLCAEAMELRKYENVYAFEGAHWNPLEEDAQAMALIKKFKLHLSYADFRSPTWTVYSGNAVDSGFTGQDFTLNRAICKCIAGMWKQHLIDEADRRFGQPHFGHD